jgi:hypothetical protein
MSKKNTDKLYINDHEVFYSYGTPLAALSKDRVYVNITKYSKTTSTQLAEYLRTIPNKKIVPVLPNWFKDQGFDVKENSRL